MDVNFEKARFILRGHLLANGGYIMLPQLSPG